MLILSVLGLILFWFGWLNRNGDLYDGRNIIEFAFLYLLGAFFHDRIVVTEDNRMHLRKIFLLAYIGLCTLIGLILYFTTGAVQSSAKNFIHPYSSPFLIAMASLLFLFFTTLSFKSRAINWAASSVLAVYLIHENRFFEFIPWYKNIEQQFLTQNAFVFTLEAFGSVCALMVISVLIDKLKNIIVNPLLRQINRHS